MELRDGETQVLAGLIQDDLSRVKSGIAGLTEIPVLGDIFSKQVKKHNKTEIILLITPHIVRNVTQPNHFESEFYSGTASAAGRVPVTIRKTTAQSLAIEPSGGSGRYVAPSQLTRGGLLDPGSDPFGEMLAGAGGDSPSLLLRAPENVGMGREFTATIRLVTQNSALSGELNLVYDPETLEVMDDGEKSGMRSLKLGRSQPTGMTAVMRFKVISPNPGMTEISLQNPQIQDEAGQTIEVDVPPATTITVQ